MKILVLNLGSTSTKLGVFEGLAQTFSHTIRHSREELAAFDDIRDQQGFRRQKLLGWLTGSGYALKDFDVIAARGGLIRPVPGGSYHINEAAAEDAAGGLWGMHPANVGMLIAREWSREFGIPAFFTDAPVTDELSDLARVSGFAGISRRSVFHALNMKRVVRLYCTQKGLDPFSSRFIVAHMGGGITVSAMDGLRAVDVNNGVDGDGPFTPERAGSLPSRQLLDLLKHYKGDPDMLFDHLYRQGGLMSYFGTNDVALLAEKSRSDQRVTTVLDAMMYSVAKQIAAMAVALQGRVEQILLTGGIANNAGMMEQLKGLVSWIAPCTVYPGEDELAALAHGAYRVMTGQEEARYIDR